MFGGKKGRVLEQELQEVKEKQKQQEQVLSGLAQKKDVFEEHFAHVTASRAQMDSDLSEVVNHVRYVKELAEADGAKAEKLCADLKTAEDLLEEAERLQKNFTEQVCVQRDKIEEIVENNKHFTTPAKYLTEFSEEFRETEQHIFEQLAQMKEFGKNMSVLSLNAAIEAGRLGDSGLMFVQAAEEVRSFSGKYEQAAATVEEELKRLEEKNQELEEQAKHLSALLRENNISMGRLRKDSMVCVDEYKKQQVEKDKPQWEECQKTAAELCGHQAEIANRQDCILVQMEEIGTEFMEQKECVDELEKVCKEVAKSAII